MEQIEEIVNLLPNDVILVVGGDFNIPQGDKVFSKLKNRMKDTFGTGGRGWCNTILVDILLLRIDQIWTSNELSCYHSYSRNSLETDHRLYTAIMKWTQPLDSNKKITRSENLKNQLND